MEKATGNNAAIIGTEVLDDDPYWETARIDATAIRRATEAVWARMATTPGTCEVSILLTSDERMRALNAQFRGKDHSTNVLSFPSGDDEYIGDIALGAETVAKEASELDLTPVDHVTHLVVHGMLHLLGYDHETNEDAEEMETTEVSILEDLGVANPYEGRALSGTAEGAV